MRWTMVMLLVTLALIVLASGMNIFPDFWDLDDVQPHERQRDRQLIRDAAVVTCAAVFGGLVLRRAERSWRTVLVLLILAAAVAGTILYRTHPGMQIMGQDVRGAQYLLALLALPAAVRLGPGLALRDITPKGLLTGRTV